MVFIIVSVISIVLIFMYIPLKLSGVLPIKNMYKPPIPLDEWKKRRRKLIEDDEDEKVDPDLIQYWPGLFTDNDF